MSASGAPLQGRRAADRSEALQRMTKDVMDRMETVSGELLALVYGSLVSQLLLDYDGDAEGMNQQLFGVGEQMGARLIDEFLGKTANIMSLFPYCCQDFPELCEVVAYVGFKLYLGTPAEIQNWNSDQTACEFLLRQNPLNEFVEMPAEFQMKELWYSNVIAGAVKGALGAVGIKVHCFFVQDALRDSSDNLTRIRVELVEYVVEEFED
ncbi:unnamed protein product [Amoebophrya sp. A25]|nr:unnamed protein product [Amoebophrya sp. A25]|eukprot:GSA25T00007210001.1